MCCISVGKQFKVKILKITFLNLKSLPNIDLINL
jgi:hypothetical protein